MSAYVKFKVLSRGREIKILNELILRNQAVAFSRPPILLIVLNTLAIENYDILRRQIGILCELIHDALVMELP